MWDTVIIGAGAAGMMCAAQGCGRTLILDHAKAAGEKIRISGGGRCNFTNMYAAPENYISHNPHFVKSALARYTQWDFIDWVARSGIAYHEKTLGQLFCDNSAKDIIAMLVDALKHAGAELRLKTAVANVEKTPRGFALTLSDGSRVESKNVVIATGGKPIPKMGATDWGLRVAEQFGLPLVDTFAGLVPFTFSGTMVDTCKSLAGVALPSVAQTSSAHFEEAVLFTHRGLSGPAALQVSSYWSPGATISLNLMAGQDAGAAFDRLRASDARKSPANALTQVLPSRLVPVLLSDLTLPPRMADLNRTDLDALENRLTDWTLTPSGTEGYRTAEVMVGGVSTDALNSKTMEAKDHPGLYFIGECVDVTGWLGGYNFQWAWSSGWAAAQAIKSTL